MYTYLHKNGCLSEIYRPNNYYTGPIYARIYAKWCPENVQTVIEILDPTSRPNQT